jgi:asparagine synthase (glutamine-hydrolysing)
LKSAYEYRMVADVPVGLFLSGGYDSSSVAALLQGNRTQKIKTFTIGYQETQFNEAPEAKKIAEYLGTDHTEYYVSAKEALEVIPLLPEIFDEPFADNSIVPTTLVSRLAIKDVKVALSADGGDEIFGGYEKFNWSVKYTQILPIWIQGLLSKSMSLINPDNLPYFNKKYNFSTRYEKIRQIWAESNAVSAMKYISQFITGKEVNSLLLNDFILYKTHFEAASQINDFNDAINKMLAIDYKTFLVDNNLAKVDRATMSVSLEGREPLLDHRVIEFVAQLPSNLKIRNGENKYILKKIVHKHIPKTLMDRPKVPFIAPLNIWYQDQLKENMKYYLDAKRIDQQGIFNSEFIEELCNKYFSGERISHQKLWNILVFQMWYERWMS